MQPTLLPSIGSLRGIVAQCIRDRDEQGHDVSGLAEQLAAAPDSYDALVTIAERLARRSLRADWPWHEPHELDEILAAAPEPTPVRIAGPDVAARIRTAFLARVSGCILGKPFEFDPDLDELRSVLEPIGEWPLRDYVSREANDRLRAPQPQWPELVREQITHVAPDDDINYTVLGMLLLEQHGAAFTAADVQRLWLYQLPVGATFGPERIQLIAMAQASLASLFGQPWPLTGWTELLNATEEHCGALIRADAYGYAFPGDPVAAASAAYVDAAVTHRRTGLYSTMWVAAVISLALVHEGREGTDRLSPFEEALCVVPEHSRFAAVVRDSLALVRAASDWLGAYQSVHESLRAYTHCRVYQEVGTLMVSARFASSVGDAIGMQVCMGNDTDSFGATCGSIMGAMLGPSAFDAEHWTGRFNDTIHLALATEWESSLSALADRMSRLPAAAAQSIAR